MPASEQARVLCYKERPMKKSTRVYRSEVRAEQAKQTRERILNALVSVMARNGIADISVPLIAKEAGVSIALVYKYYPTKKRLIAALDEYAHNKGLFTLAELGPIETADDLADIVPVTFKRRKAVEETLSAAMSSRLGYTIRRPEFEERRQWIANALGPVAKKLTRKERAQLVNVVFVLNSFATVKAFKDYLGLDTDEAARHVAWAIRALVKGAAASKKKKSS